jgi:signal peptidase
LEVNRKKRIFIRMAVHMLWNGRPMKNAKLKKTLLEMGKDILIAFAIVGIVLALLFAYCGVWPPMVVVESGSMEHFDDRSEFGVIDTGDMVFVKSISGAEDVVTYVDGSKSGYSTYGAYGDVVIYRPNGLDEDPISGAPVVPIIHRAVVWIDVNTSLCSNVSGNFDYAHCSFDVPSLGKWGVTEDIHLYPYGHASKNVTIRLGGILSFFAFSNKIPHGGFITLGDHNTGTDQPGYEPVLTEWVVGKAIGEIPWFGLIKLKVTGANLNDVPGNSWAGLLITIALIITIPILFDFLAPRMKKQWKNRNGDGAEELGAPPYSNSDNGPQHGPSMPVAGEKSALANGAGQPAAEPAGPASDRDVKDRVIVIKEIVRVPCPHCNVLVENTDVKCPHCGSPLR